MYTTSKQKENCPFDFTYDSFGYWYLVYSDIFEKPEDKIFHWISGIERLQKNCTSQTTCDHTTCEYKKELIIALQTKNLHIHPKEILENNK